MTLNEFCKIVRVTRMTGRRYIELGVLKATKIPKKRMHYWHIDEKELGRFLIQFRAL